MERLLRLVKLLKVGDLAVRRNPLFYRDIHNALEQVASAALAERRTWTRAKLSEVLWNARRSAYGNRIRGTDDPHSWPLLSKDTVRADPAAFHAGATLLTIKSSTGGTSGSPLPLVRSLRSIVAEQVCLDRMQSVLGIDSRRARIAVLRTESIKDPNDFSPPYWVSASGGQRIVFSSYHLNATTLPAYVQALREFRPDILLGYPTSLDALCLLLQQCETKLSIPRVMCSSEVLHAETWAAAREQLGCTLLDYYGQAERVAFAYATEPNGYRFLPGYAHVEFIPAEREGDQQLLEVVGTSLWNLAMPLVRYRTGDLIRVPADWSESELEELAFGLRTFPGVLGRDSDILLSPQGVKITGLSHFHRNIAHLRRVQIIQETPDRVRMLLIVGSGFTARDEAQLMSNVREKLPHSMQVTLERVPTLERTQLGKTPFVIHRPPVKELLRRTAVSRAAGT
jgi:phenylacetate-CoA ligase